MYLCACACSCARLCCRACAFVSARVFLSPRMCVCVHLLRTISVDRSVPLCVLLCMRLFVRALVWFGVLARSFVTTFACELFQTIVCMMSCERLCAGRVLVCACVLVFVCVCVSLPRRE